MSKGQVRLGVTVERNNVAVFDFLADLTRAPEWDSRVTKVVAMTRGTLRVGSRLRSTIDAEGETVQLDDEITAFDRPACLGLRSVHGATNAVTYSLMDSGDNRTSLDVVLEYDLDLPPSPSLTESQVREAIAAGLGQALQQLKDILEREGKSGGAGA